MEERAGKLDYQRMLWDFIGVAWRRRFWVIGPLIIGMLISIYFILTLPKIYQSSTLILVEGQKIPENIVKSAVTGSAEDRLRTIKQQILSRSFLKRIIGKFELFRDGEASNKMSLNAKIAHMRENIEVETRGRRRLESFSISFSGKDPETVMNVTNELASLIMEENLKIREQFVEGAIDFLDVEMKNIKRDLEHQEKRLSEYRHRHIGELPGQLDANLRALDRFQADLASIQIGKKSAQDRAIDLERKLEITQRELKQMNQSGVPVVKSPLSPLIMELNQRRKELSNLLIEYNEDYPDVVILRREIRSLEDKAGLTEMERDIPLTSEENFANGSGKKAGGDVEPEPVFLIRRQIEQTNDALKELIKREKKILKQIPIYERRVENTPKREQELIILQRDYDNISSTYQSLLSKKLGANISENLEKRQKGEQFKIIDSANLPETPIKPDKVNIGFMGILLGLVAGVGLAFVREQLDNSVRKPEEVERITSSLILAEIPDFNDENKKHGIYKKGKVVKIEKFSGHVRSLRRGGAKN